jgi:hypothetical protein
MGVFRRLFARHAAKKLGVTEDSVRAHLLAMDAEQPVDDGRAVEVLAIEVGRRAQAANSDAWCEADGDGFDWEGLLEFISKLIEMLMPFILKSRQPK